MTKGQFKEAFKRGLGSAFIELRSSDRREKYKDIVLWCCLHNTCYDMQCEGGRGTYLYKSICLFNDQELFEKEIIKRFMNRKLDTWLFAQYCELLVEFARDGNVKAREALYDKYSGLLTHISKMRKRGAICDDRDNFEWLCVWLTSLDGFKAYKKIVEQVGEYYLQASEEDGFSFEWFHVNAENKFGKKRTNDYLIKNASKSMAIAAFLKQTNTFETFIPTPNPPPTFKELIEVCETSSGYRGIGIAFRFAKIASVEELTELAQIAIKETNPDIKIRLLSAFRKKPFPLDEGYIFELAESDNEFVRDIAFEILQNLSSHKIHDYALSLLSEKREMANALSLLCHCYEPDDEAILEDSIKDLTISYDEGSWHGVFMDVEYLLNKGSFRLKSDLFIDVYKKTLCSSCRDRLVRRMSKRKILPRVILEECVHDSNDDIRRFAISKLKNMDK